jgi:hypothetical protein
MFHADHLVAARMRLRVTLLGQKPRIGLVRINHAVASIGEHELDTAVMRASAKLGKPITMPTPRSTRAFGDGTFLQSIIDWFKSPEGQAVLKALLQIAMMFLKLAAAELPEGSLDVTAATLVAAELLAGGAKPKARSRKK